MFSSHKTSDSTFPTRRDASASAWKASTRGWPPDVLARGVSDDWRPRGTGTTLILLVVPFAGAVLVAVASRNDRLYRLLVKEDALLEWGQVGAYVVGVAIALLTVRATWRRGDSVAAVVLVALATLAVLSVGEELSWGQRLFDFETPSIASDNRQGEFTLHNDATFEHTSRVALLLGAMYGLLAPFVVRRRTPLVPPRWLAGYFGVVVAYMAYRLVALERPSYVEAKYSEWPEFCFAAALALWCGAIAQSSQHLRRPAGLRPRAGGHPRV